MLGTTGDIAINSLITSTRDLNRYLDYLGDALPGQSSNVAYSLPLSDEEALGISEHRRAYIDEHFSDDFLMDFRKLLYKSIIITLYSKLETELLEFSEDFLELEISVSLFSVNKLGRGAIDRVRQFLSVALEYEIDSELWKELSNFRKLRNYLVHQDSVYTAYPDKKRGKSKVTVDIGNGEGERTFYLPVDQEFHQYLVKHKMLSFYGSMTEDGMSFGDECAIFGIETSYEYCKYLIDFRKRFFLGMYRDLIEIAQTIANKE